MCGITLTIRLKPPPLPDSTNGGGTAHGTRATDALFESLRAANATRGPDFQSTFVHTLTLENGAEVEICLSAAVLGLRGSGVTPQPIVGRRGALAWNGQVFNGLELGVDENDTRKISNLLESGQDISSVLSSIEGPYAFVYLDLTNDKLYYQVDPISRRSLLRHGPSSESGEEGMFILSSTRSSYARDHQVEMKALLGGEGGTIDLRKLSMRDVTGKQVLHFSEAHTAKPLLTQEDGVFAFTQVSPINPCLPPDPLPAIIEEGIDTFLRQLGDSVRRKVENIPPLSDPRHARAAVLFSGGVDSVLLAYMVHLWLPCNEPIDLINVAFQQRPPRPPNKIRNGDVQLMDETAAYNVPDRIGGREALVELQRVTDGREWRFVEIDVTQTDYLEKRKDIVDLMYPCTTEMDLSLASPFYFASRGIGHLRTPNGEKTPYTVKAKVYFSGLGPDEQLAGYSRHRQAYLHRGWSGLIEEVQLDVSRLSTRNTSRDDRLLSHFARDARFPYLDLSFIAYLSSLPLWEKCDPTLSGGDKLLLRLAARKVGLTEASGRVKRAMQFGSRSAKIGEIKREEGEGKRRGKGIGARSVV